MLTAAILSEEFGATRSSAARGELTAFLMGLAESVGADGYTLLTIAYTEGRADARVIASNWSFDTIGLAGTRLLARIATGTLATSPGDRAAGLDCTTSPRSEAVSTEQARFLYVAGHGEIFCLKLHAGRKRLFLLLSAAEPGSIDAEKLTAAQVECCYALSDRVGLLTAAAPDIPLTDRERECLIWVCEGKTSDDIALIVGVSPNTVNNYITAAIHKLASSNRAMAVATAIRGGVI